MIRLLPLLLAAGCSTTYVTNPLPEPPVYLTQCAARAAVPLPVAKPTKAELEVLIARLMTSEVSAIECAEAWAAWYDDLSR